MNEKKLNLRLLIVIIICLTLLSIANSIRNDKFANKESIDKSDNFLKKLGGSTTPWTLTEVISTESTVDSRAPSTAVDGFGNVHIAWNDLTDFEGSGTEDYDIFYKYYNVTTGIWNTTKVVSTESTHDSRAPSIAVDRSGNIHIVWGDDTNYASSGTDEDIFYKYFNTTTGIWSPLTIVSTESTGNSWVPSLFVDSFENLHIAWNDDSDYMSSGTDRDIFYKYYNVTKGFWNTTTVVSTESTKDSWSPSIKVDGSGNVHVSWWDLTDYGGSGTDTDIFYKNYNATTMIWNTTTVVSMESTNGSMYPSIAVDKSENVHIAWKDVTDYRSSGTDNDIFYKYYNATTGIWNMTTVVSTESTDDSWTPSIGMDAFENVHIAWYDYTNYGGSGTDHDIFYKYYNASKGIWNITTVVSTESTRNSFLPSITVDSYGSVQITWQDYTDYDGSGTDLDIFYKRTKTKTNLNLSKNPNLSFFESDRLFNITAIYNDTAKGIDSATIGIKINGIPYIPAIIDNFAQGYYNITIECNASQFGNYGISIIEVNATKTYFTYQSKQLSVFVIGNTFLSILNPSDYLGIVEGTIFNITVDFRDNARNSGIIGAIINYSIANNNYRGDNVVDNGDGTYNITIDIDDIDFGNTFNFISIIINASRDYYFNKSSTLTIHRQIPTTIDPGNNINFGSIFRSDNVSYTFNYNDNIKNPVQGASISILGSAQNFTWISIEEGNGNYTISLNSTYVIARETVYNLQYSINAIGNETQIITIQIFVLLPKTAVVGITSNMINNVVPVQSNLTLSFNFTDLYKNIPITTITTDNITIKQGYLFWYDVVGKGLGDPKFLNNGGWKLIHNGNGNYTLNISNYQLTLGNRYNITIQINYTSINPGPYNSSIINIQFYYGFILIPLSGGSGDGDDSVVKIIETDENIILIIIIIIIVTILSFFVGTYKKKANIPKRIIKGIGHDIFISYSNKDENIAKAVCHFLEENRTKCWIAPRDVGAGIYARSIMNAINSCKLMVLIYTKHVNFSEHVKKELERAVAMGKPIIPLRIEEVSPSPEIEYYISEMHWLDAMTPPLEQHLTKLVSVVGDLLDSLHSIR